MVLSVRALTAVLALVWAGVACGESTVTTSSADPATKGSSTTTSAPGQGASSVKGSSPAPSAAAPIPKSNLAGTWTAPFVSERAKLTLDPGVFDKAWAADEGKDAVGDGTLELTIEEDGRVKGKLGGALGELTLAGMADGDVVNATFSSERPEPTTFAGTIELAKKGDALEGELRASNGDAKIVRRATLTLKKK